MRDILCGGLVFVLVFMPCLGVFAQGTAQDYPAIKDVSVHDPSIILADDGYYYIFGSHMAAARSADLMVWEMISKNASDGCTLVENVQVEMKDALSWAKTTTFWAPDVRRLKDGRYYMYYCCCVGNAPLSAMGVAVSSKPQGPYKNLGIILRSGMSGKSEDGTNYNATVHPNVVDPNVFYDKDGKLWMVYGSYSGGIYILAMDENTGFPLPGQGYGKKLLGKNHSRIEGPYILYNPDTDYYYLFLSFGGLTANEGYNIRVCRSKNPDGPYTDAMGQDMIKCGGRAGSFFLDQDIEGYGVKLMGGYQFLPLPGEANRVSIAYRSPGHNSALYDQTTGRYFIVFHTRFAGMGEAHSVRVHQMYFNLDGWPVIAPHRYAGETLGDRPLSTAGDYKVILHLRDINKTQHGSVEVTLHEDGTAAGSLNGVWECNDGVHMAVTLDGIRYTGVFAPALDSASFKWTTVFTALSADGAAIWGSRSTAGQ
jgi:arabinan endo-1,5-alpha-L-arabinosidase